MRIIRLLLIVAVIFIAAQPVFACRECFDDGTGELYCAIRHEPTWGCEWTADAQCYTPFVYCSGGYVEHASVEVASVEVTHFDVPAAPADTAVKMAVVTPLQEHHQKTR